MDSYNDSGYEGENETALDTKEYEWIGFTSTAALWSIFAIICGSVNTITLYLGYDIFIAVVKQTQGY